MGSACLLQRSWRALPAALIAPAGATGVQLRRAPVGGRQTARSCRWRAARKHWREAGLLRRGKRREASVRCQGKPGGLRLTLAPDPLLP